MRSSKIVLCKKLSPSAKVKSQTSYKKSWRIKGLLKILKIWRLMKMIRSWKRVKKDDVQYSLFKDLHQMEMFECKGLEWISQQYFEELFELLENYPKHHSTIIKASKISKSTYQRLMKEIKYSFASSQTIRRQLRNNQNLTIIKKEWVKRIMRPPTKSLTLDDI